MTDTSNLQVVKDLPNKKVIVTRYFDATPDLVWRAWTEPELLEQWWAPQPWRAETKKMNFSIGGYWLYAMIGPDGSRQWARINFLGITPHKHIEAHDTFSDENGNPTSDLPGMHWKINFLADGQGTKVVVDLTFANESDLQKILEMGFEQGFSTALSQLDNYLRSKLQLRKEAKTSNTARVTTYLNFPGNTEEAMLFYKKVFKGEFTGYGLQHFADVDMPAGSPPISEEHKKLILHAELTILGGHVLMATDAPESMGFTLIQGNNMHINLEPDSREETKRLFDALAEGGTITMPLADMFFGAFFGSLTDKYGINWMLHYQLAR